MVCRSKGEQLMILSHKEIEEIAAAVTEDFNEFFSALRLKKSKLQGLRPLTSLQRTISVLPYHSQSCRRTGASADLRLMPIQSTQLRKEALSANLRSGKIKFCWMRVLFSPDKFGRFAENADSH